MSLPRSTPTNDWSTTEITLPVGWRQPRPLSCNCHDGCQTRIGQEAQLWRWVRATYYAERSMSDPRFLVLVSLSDGPRHGYSMQHDIEAFAGARLGPGTLYGAINTLERDQLIEPVPTMERRRPYRLTPAGRHHLRQQLEMLDRIRARTAAAKLA